MSDFNKGEETMKTENELIAEFMGGTFEKREIITIGGKREGKWTFRHGLWFYDDQLDYDKRWDRLMPVVERMYNLWEPADDQTPFQKSLNLRLHAFTRKNPIHSHIQQVYKNVVEFIRWYNSQNS